MIWIPPEASAAPLLMSKPKRSSRPIIKAEGESDTLHDSNNNCARVPDWKSFLREGSKEDVYQFDEGEEGDDDDDDSLQGVKRSVIAKPKDCRRVSGKSKSVKMSPSSKIPIVKSEILQLKREISMEEERAETLPAGVTTPSNLGQGNKQQGPSTVAKTECRKSSRRRPSVLYLEDPFQIILDSDELEDFDFENGDLFLSRKSDSLKKSLYRGGGRKNNLPKPKSKRAVTLKSEPVQEIVVEPEPENIGEPPSPVQEVVPVAEPVHNEPPEVEAESETESKSRDSPEFCEYRIEPITPTAKQPQVNPIFLWVRQEDSYIVDVRCEDYDKRNRIRLTKSANGSWRAMPRTEAYSRDLAPLSRDKHKRRSKEKKSKKKKKRHRHHHHREPSESTRAMKQHQQMKMQSCKVSLVPLPDLMLCRARSQEVSVNLESQCSTGGAEGRKKTHVPNASLAAQESANNNNGDSNNNTDTARTKRKHVRFALDHSELSNGASSGGVEEKTGDVEGRRQYGLGETQCSQSASQLGRGEATDKDASTTVQFPLHRQRGNDSNTNSSNNSSGWGPFSQKPVAVERAVVKEEEAAADEDVGKSSRLRKSTKQSSDSASGMARGARDEIENAETVQRLENASPAVVTREPLLATSDTSRRRVSTHRSTVCPGHNNNLQEEEQQHCIESASPVICTNTETNADQTTTPVPLKRKEFSSRQGTRIFTAPADDVNNNNCGPKVDKRLPKTRLLAREDEVIVIGEECTKGDSHYLVIEDDDDDDKDAQEREGHVRAVGEKRQGRRAESDPGGDSTHPVIELQEQDGDDDVTFVCRKSPVTDSANLSEAIGNNIIASNSCARLGDALQQPQQQHQSVQQMRILTPEEQLHESLKATTELIAGIGGFEFVSSLGEESENMSFGTSGATGGGSEIDEDHCLGATGVCSGDGGISHDDSMSQSQHQPQQQHQRVHTTLHNSMTSFCGARTRTAESEVMGDEYNDDDEILMDAVAPVADIISRLSDSPKCLTFNEMGEIEAISANAALFEKHTMDSMDVLAMSIKELAEKNIKELAAKAVVAAAAAAVGNNNSSSNNMTTVESSTSGVCEIGGMRNRLTPDSCGGGGSGEEYPRDLTCKLDRSTSISNINCNSNKTKMSPIPRSVSRGSDAIQSPQPSGLPAIPQSPDIFTSNAQRSKSVFLESILTTPAANKAPNPFSVNRHPKQQQQEQPSHSDGGGGVKQKEPLDLGACRKSASPTVTCSEEVSKRHHDEIVDLVSELESSSASSSTSESSRKRVKYELTMRDADGGKPESQPKKPQSSSGSREKPEEETANHKMESGGKSESSKSANEAVTGYLMDILNTNAKDPDPLTQLRLLISNTEWKVPETLLVPKDRLNAVLASPAREIPLLLTTRPELRLPGAFAFPSILQDPDILVVSLAQLEAILEKQQEIFKLKANERAPAPKRDQEMRQKSSTVTTQKTQQQQQHITEKQHENIMHQQIQRAISNKLGVSQQKAPLPHVPANLSGAQSAMGSGLASDIDAATIAAFNQMLWLPYLNQMRGQITPEVIKAVAGFNEMLPLLAAQSRIQQGLMAGQNNMTNASVGSSLGNSLEFAMWQEAMLNANNANLRALIKGQQAAGAVSGASEFAKKQMDPRKCPSTATASFSSPGKMPKHQTESQHLPNPLSPLSIPPFAPPPAMQGSSRYFNPMLAAASQQQSNRSPMPSPTNLLQSPFSPNYRSQQQSPQQQQQQRGGGGHRFNIFSPGGAPSQAQQLKKGGMTIPPNHFFPFGQNTQSSPMDFEDQMSLLANKKAQKELEQVLQMQQQQQQQQQQHQQRLQNQQAKFAQEQKLNKLGMFSSAQSMQQQQQMNSFLNTAKMSLHHHQQQQQQQMFNQQMMNQLNELSKLSSLMAMPSAFDSPLSANPLLAAPQAPPAVHGQGGNSQQHMGDSGGGREQPKLKLKVKPGMHLLDPVAMQRRLLTNHSTESSDDMSAEIVSTTTSQSGLDTSSSPDINSPLWHPLFGNSGQKLGNSGSTYTSPWQWTTITTAGE